MSFTRTLMQTVLSETGITATAGIGTNLYLAKVAMDISAKNIPLGENGERIAELDEMKYREQLWCHKPLTDFWRIGRGYSSKLELLGLNTMGDIAKASLSDAGEDLLYKTFGINAELLIDHAWGWEPTTIDAIKTYRPETKSLSSGQVLKEPYTYDKTKVIIKEMTELLALDLVSKKLMTKQLVLTIGYDRESIRTVPGGNGYEISRTGKTYSGKVTADHYGRIIPGHAHGTGNLLSFSNSTNVLTECVTELFERITDPDLLVRRVNIAACDLRAETDIPQEYPVQLDLFSDPDELETERESEKQKKEKEHSLQTAILTLQSRYGKNAVLKGLNFEEGATTIERNSQIGGHRAE